MLKNQPKLESMLKKSNTKTWNNLSSEQQQEVLLAYQESESNDNLIDNESIINRIKKIVKN